MGDEWVASAENLAQVLVPESAESEARASAQRTIEEFFEEVKSRAVTYSSDLEAMINEMIARIDGTVSAQLNEIMHHEKFQKLEASWRGLAHLVSRTETGELLKLKVMSIGKEELRADLTTGPATMNVEKSSMFYEIYQKGYNVLGGTPYGALIGDYEFDKNDQDMKLLTRISQVAAIAHAPFITGTQPSMFGLDSFTELSDMYELQSTFEAPQWAAWRAFRDSEDSRYVGICAPRMLIREPYGPDNVPVKAFDFRENVTGADHEKYLWANAAWGLAGCITEAFSLYGFCVRIRGVESGGKVSGLPNHTFRRAQGDFVQKCPTEVLIPGDQEFELAKLGFIPLANIKNTTDAVFMSVQSANRPKEYQGPKGDMATGNALLSAQINYMFAVSRFSHYLKNMVRDWIGMYQTREGLEQDLKNWFGNYVLLEGTQEAKATHPLRAAEVFVQEDSKRPGTYQAVALVQPHLALDAVGIEMRLVADIEEATS